MPGRNINDCAALCSGVEGCVGVELFGSDNIGKKFDCIFFTSVVSGSERPDDDADAAVLSQDCGS